MQKRPSRRRVSCRSSNNRRSSRDALEARALKDEAAKIGEQLREELRKQGEEEYRRLVERATVDIDASARRAAEELRAQVAGLVMVVAERVLGEGITIAGQEQLVDRAITEIERQAATDGAGSPGARLRTTKLGRTGLGRDCRDESRRVVPRSQGEWLQPGLDSLRALEKAGQYASGQYLSGRY